jgi:hypothetical protein
MTNEARIVDEELMSNQIQEIQELMGITQKL